MQVLDEHGERWEVKNGDPGWKAIKYLKGIGFTNIILPLSILIHGNRVRDLPWPTMDELRRRMDGDADAFLQYASLYDQAEALSLSGEF